MTTQDTHVPTTLGGHAGPRRIIMPCHHTRNVSRKNEFDFVQIFFRWKYPYPVAMVFFKMEKNVIVEPER
jgi:hypothetical protein